MLIQKKRGPLGPFSFDNIHSITFPEGKSNQLGVLNLVVSMG